MRSHAAIEPTVWWVPVTAILVLGVLAATDGNLAAFQFINRWSRVTGPAPWPYITILGDTAVAIALFLPLAMRRSEVLWALAISALLATLFVHGLKPLLSLPRPPAVLAADAITIIGPAHRGNAFPSGHTTTIFLAAGLVWLYFRSMPLRVAAVGVALVVGLSRAVVGVHWPMDIAAGAAGGWTCAILGTALARRWAGTGRRQSMRSLLQALGGTCGLMLLVGSGTGYPQAIALQYAAGVVGIVVPAWMALGDFRQHRRKEG
jgi:membrane-associated phospholipid phosphatase